MPGTDAAFAARLTTFLVSFIGLAILILFSILYARKTYWDITHLSKRQQQKQARARPKIIFLIACLITGAVTILLAFFVNILIALIVATIAFLIILLMFLGSGRGGGKSTPGDADPFTLIGS
jgi:hypothetical protein